MKKFELTKKNGNKITLYNGDCLDIIPALSNIDAVITDPPYGSTNLEFDMKVGRKGALSLFLVVYNEVCKILPEKANFITFGDFPFLAMLYCEIPEKCGIFSPWIKSRPCGFVNANIQPMIYAEYILRLRNVKNGVYNPQFVKAKKTTLRNDKTGKNNINHYSEGFKSKYDVRNNGLKRLGNVYNFNSVHNRDIHPTQKPVDLLERLVKEYSNENNTILDPFAGSGSTGIACMNTGRNFIGIEKDAKYFEMACKNLEKAEKELANKLI